MTPRPEGLSHARSAPALALLLALLSQSGCERADTTGSPLQRILEAGELRVGTAANVPPLAMRDRAGKLIGLEIDLVRALGGAMNLKVRFIELAFAELLPALERGEVDLAIAGLTMTAERNARVAFAGPYFVSGTSVLSKAPELVDVEDAAALNAPERRFAALEASTGARFVTQHMPTAKLVTVADNDAGVALVLNDEVDALIADFQVCAVARWRHPEAGLHTRYSPFTTEPLGIALPPNAPLFLNLVTNYLNTLEETGELAQLKARWLGDGSWIEALP